MAARGITKNDFQKFLFNAIKTNTINRHNRLGVAVNHKPESWALIGLLRDCFPKESLHAISVDLKLNAQKSRKILDTAEKLSKIGIPIKLLECDWKEETCHLHGKVIKHKVNKMLVKECKKNNISILALGNTLEDYLTELLREIFSLKAGYIHGLDVFNRLGVEGDNVMALRPLLKYNMNQILATCREYQLSPNHNHILDQEGSSKNLVKKMIIDACDSESQQIGDTFLTVPKLLDLGFQMFEHRLEVWKRVSIIFKRNIRCDESLGLYFIKINIGKNEQRFHWMNDIEITHTIFTILLSIINGADPLSTKYTPEILEKFRLQLMNNSTRRIPISIAKGMLNPPRASDTGRGVWIFGRQPFSKKEIKDLTYSVKSGELILWDKRFKITVSWDDPEKSFLIRPLILQDFTYFEDQLNDIRLPIKTTHLFKEKFKRFKTRTPLALRQTLPCIEMDGKVISIPPLDINFEKNVSIDFRYCGYQSAFGKVVGLSPEHFETEPESEETQSDSHMHLEE